MSKYKEFTNLMEKIADVQYSMAVMQWDKEVNLPKKGAKFRSQQVATLAGIVHELATGNQLGELLEELSESNDLSPNEQKNIKLTTKQYNRSKKYSKAFVVKRSQLISKAYHDWMKAREANDYSIYQSALGDIITIKREEAELLGYKDHPYNALIDLYEPGTTVSALDKLFTDVRSQLVDFVREIRQRPQIDSSFLKKYYNKDKQWNFGLAVLKDLGYDFEAGRQDISTHPFTVNFNPNDVRLTTRLNENDLSSMTWSTIHECGHALYEQGLPSGQYGLPLGKYISLGIHESQSRLWENNVGRALPYWKANYSKLQATFPDNLNEVDLITFYKGMNKTEPHFIRTESDELHYHFHILIRYELEKQLMEGAISTKELDQHWNEKYKSYLDLDVPDAKRGILQDIHWAHGSIGYFPTYSLGSFYAAQFYQQANKEIENLEDKIANGNTAELLSWLRTNIHQYGRQYTAEELCIKLTGEPLNFRYFMDYAKEKYARIYGL